MSHDFLYGFINECANLINNLYDYNNYDHLAIKLCSEFIIPIINITKKEHIKEYNEHIKNIIDNLESTKHIKEYNEHIKNIIGNSENTQGIYSICLYLMNICCEEYFKLSQNEYLEIKKFIDNNIDIIESTLAPMNNYFNSCKNAIVIIIALVIVIIKKIICIFPQNR